MPKLPFAIVGSLRSRSTERFGQRLESVLRSRSVTPSSKSEVSQPAVPARDQRVPFGRGPSNQHKAEQVAKRTPEEKRRQLYLAYGGDPKLLKE